MFVIMNSIIKYQLYHIVTQFDPSHKNAKLEYYPINTQSNHTQIDQFIYDFIHSLQIKPIVDSYTYRYQNHDQIPPNQLQKLYRQSHIIDDTEIILMSIDHFRSCTIYYFIENYATIAQFKICALSYNNKDGQGSSLYNLENAHIIQSIQHKMPIMLQNIHHITMSPQMIININTLSQNFTS